MRSYLPRTYRSSALLLPLLAALTFAGRARAEAPPQAASAAPEKPRPQLHFKEGPATIDLGHAVKVNLPETDRFLEKGEANGVLERMGNFGNEHLLGLVAPKDPEANWFAIYEYNDEGHVKDDEKIDATELLKAISEGVEDGNSDRKERGFPDLHVDGWQVPPTYTTASHQLAWALVVSDTDGKSVNFSTRMLGRKGYVSLNLVTDPEKLEAFRGDAMTLLSATAFDKGAKYEDFDTKTDKLAEYGLKGLILGGAGLGIAKIVKIGLLAKFGKVIIAALIAGKKAIFVAIAGGVAFLKRLFGRKPAALPATASAVPAAAESTAATDDSGSTS